MGADFLGGGVFAVDLDAPEPAAHRLEGPSGILDGIALASKGRLLISDWISNEPVPGRLLIVPPESGAERSIALDLHGPADFYLDRKHAALWIPAMTDNCVIVVHFDRG